MIGLGYVGSVAAAGLAHAGHQVIGIDNDSAKVAAYREGTTDLREQGLAELMANTIARGDLRLLHSDEVAEPLGDVVVVATGTPSGAAGAADLSQVRSALSWISDRGHTGVIAMKSTVPPGTGERFVGTAKAARPLRYASNPEFLREGQAVQDWFHPDRIVIGATATESIETLRTLYENADAPFLVTDVTSAEMIKYASNAFLATKISFINEIAMLCERVGATIDDVSAGLAMDNRISPDFLKAGVGYGGSCFPKDVRALDQLALTNGHNFELLRSVITVNNRQRLLPLIAMRERFGNLTEVRTGVLGVTFKPGTGDTREAPSLDLISALVDEGAEVRAYDPQKGPHMRAALPPTVPLTDSPVECAVGTQAVVLMTEWPEIVQADWSDIADRMAPPRLVFDGRNALDPATIAGYGLEYRGVGRIPLGVGPSTEHTKSG